MFGYGTELSLIPMFPQIYLRQKITQGMGVATTAKEQTKNSISKNAQHKIRMKDVSIGIRVQMPGNGSDARQQGLRFVNVAGQRAMRSASASFSTA